MKSTGKIAAIIAATAAFTLAFSPSASAEDRHRDGTARNDSGYSRQNDSYRNNNQHRDESRNTTRVEPQSNYRNEARNNTRVEPRSNYRNESRNDTRYESRNNTRFESRNNTRFESRSNHYDERGRISRFVRERDGYRVWLGGARSYWIPGYRLGGHRLSIGLELRLGGIFNGTYVDVDALGWPGDPYYADGYYGGGYYDRYDGGLLSGRVERVDYRYGTMLLRDDRSGRVVEVDMRATERRGGLDFGDVRPGDLISVNGSWDGRFFHAYRIDGLRPY